MTSHVHTNTVGHFACTCTVCVSSANVSQLVSLCTEGSESFELLSLFPVDPRCFVFVQVCVCVCAFYNTHVTNQRTPVRCHELPRALGPAQITTVDLFEASSSGVITSDAEPFQTHSQNLPPPHFSMAALAIRAHVLKTNVSNSFCPSSLHTPPSQAPSRSSLSL